MGMDKGGPQLKVHAYLGEKGTGSTMYDNVPLIGQTVYKRRRNGKYAFDLALSTGIYPAPGSGVVTTVAAAAAATRTTHYTHWEPGATPGSWMRFNNVTQSWEWLE
jgi:hypothetical protein